MYAFRALCTALLWLVASVSFALPLTQPAPPDPGAVTTLPGYSGNITGQESGHLKVNQASDGSAAYIFYWFVESVLGKDAPIVVWLNGGPGASSIIGSLVENGPFRIDPDAMRKGETNFIHDNPNSWHKAAAYLMIDQPADTGLSFSTGDGAAPKTDNDATEQLYTGLQAFFAKHPEFRNRKLYLFGESYAGHYIPDLATKILQANEEQLTRHWLSVKFQALYFDGVFAPLTLAGIGIGDPWVAPSIQNALMLTYLYQHARLTLAQTKVGLNLLNDCWGAIDNHKSGEEPASVNTTCMKYVNYLVGASGVNLYDIRRPGPDYDFSYIGEYMNRQDVRTALNAVSVVDHKWSESSNTIANRLAVGEQNTKAPLFTKLINSMPVLLYHGDQDICCNLPATQAWLDGVNFQDQDEFQSATPIDFFRDGFLYQTYRKAGNLTVYTFGQSGHMVPMDQPEDALEMLKNFLTDQNPKEALEKRASQNPAHDSL